MWYYRKKDILKRIGKWEKYIRALDRAVRKGRVVQEEVDWITRRATRDDYDMDSIVKLNERVKLLEKKLKEANVNSEAAINAEYYEKKYNEEVEANQQMIRNMYRYITSKLRVRVEWEQFRDFAINGEEDCNY